jgi:hypothetical protein
MKNLVANIEKSLILHDSDSHNNNMFSNFNTIIQAITKSSNRKDLEKNMLSLFSYYTYQRYFHYGFGGNHMWLKQKQLDGNSFDDRILIVIINDND